MPEFPASDDVLGARIEGILTDELARTMRLCGTRSVAEIDSSLIA